ncbi:MAG: pyridoxamine 5'-phosphate oxidase family protein [Proteobacteria bacterium]|nr:pyridoxamine 5'-phosphate oxidase family protein [Pseudomonadota bacterium]
MLKKIAELVQAQGHLVLATCSCAGREGYPHTSLMSYCPSPDGREFWLATLADTRKYANLQANPRASLLLDDRGGRACGSPSLALTVAAECVPFASAADEAGARRALLARHPELGDFLAADGALVLRLRGLRYQLLSGLTEVFVWSPAEKP